MKKNEIKKEVNKYWEDEEGETVEFGNYFMRCFEKAGKLQFGTISRNKKTGSTNFYVKFALDRDALINSEEGADYLMQTIEDWKNQGTANE